MQPAEEVQIITKLIDRAHTVKFPYLYVTDKNLDILVRPIKRSLKFISDKEVLLFKHHRASMASIECGNKDGRCYEEKKELIFLSYSNTSSTNTSFYIPTTATDLKNWILRNPYIKGDLVDLRTGASWKFRTVKPFISDDIFWKKFDRSKVDSDFKEELFIELRDVYMQHDNPETDPLYGPHSKRKEVLRSLSSAFRVVNLNDKKGWRPHRIGDLPDPSMGRPMSLDTLNRYIQAIEK